MITRESRSAPGLRLALLLTALGLTNLANYDEVELPKCNCSEYRGQLKVDAYLVLDEGDTGSLSATFPERALWSITQEPNPKVISEFGAAVGNQGRQYTIDLTAASPIERPNFSYGFTPKPARRTHIEITAEPVGPDPRPESRRTTLVVQLPSIRFRPLSNETPVRFEGDPEMLWRVWVDTPAPGEWSFEFDASDAPSLENPSVLERLDPATVKIAIPFADALEWSEGRYCRIQEPLHATATDGDRVVHRTKIVHIYAEPPCPQPENLGN